MSLTSTTISVASVEDAIGRLREQYISRYGAVVFEVEVTGPIDGRVTLGGTVLLPAQRIEAVAAAEQAAGAPVEDRLTVLVEREGGPWFAAVTRVRAHSRPGGQLATEIVPGDPPFRRLGQDGEWSVVELADGTVGWVAETSGLETATAPDSVASWRADYRGNFRAPAQRWTDSVVAWLGTPYVWGGSSRDGVDCSGFVQRVVKEATGLGLPKHSSDQFRIGTRIDLSDAAPGDLVYLSRRDDGVRHIALVIEGSPLQVAHAARERGVVMESLADLVGRYELRGVSRLGPIR